jgi:cell cycle checkpoint protein
MNNLCRITYAKDGAPLSIILTEASIRTTCDLSTYEPEYTEEIPFDRRAVVLKTIMRGTWMYDALSELSSTAPDKLTMYAKMVKGKPFFAMSASGTLGSARVEFNNQPQPITDDALDPPANLLETFQLSDTSDVLRSTYKFDLIQKASRAMSVAKKVSIRMDEQGVLSLQFMVEVEAAGAAPGASAGAVVASEKLSFVDFVVVPMIEEDDDKEGDGGEGDIDETIMMKGGASDGDEDMLE